ncbi:sensor histidine kinase [Paraflavitalea speifideaquila]|uniref:sensor histidine kinase n=1 Tax=Paraflavitalea speifideaquila TaxID=3076558 RepID=UPI0028E5F3CA|nr:histidine kinase [Paraflavitalea speifideiaquila]
MAKRNSYYWLCQIGGWGLVGLSMLFYAFTFKEEISNAYLYRILIYVVSGIVSTHILREFLKRTNWLLLPIEKMVTRLGAAVIITSILYGLLVLGAYEVFKFENKNKLDFSTRLFANVLNIGIFMIPWILLYYFYHYIEKSRRQQVDTLKLESLVKELELKTIKSHINPHFIFNALNSIRALIDENPNRARNAITELSNILRSSMQAEKLETVPFEKELNIVKDYLALEYIRFEDRLSIEYQIDEDTLDQPVPPMMLQTLVENAIKHGIGKQVSGGIVKVISDFKNDFHELVVLNSGSLNGHYNGDGFGLSSTKNRLQLLFGEKANFEIKQVDAGLVEARILIPVEIK